MSLASSQLSSISSTVSGKLATVQGWAEEARAAAEAAINAMTVAPVTAIALGDLSSVTLPTLTAEAGGNDTGESIELTAEPVRAVFEQTEAMRLPTLPRQLPQPYSLSATYPELPPTPDFPKLPGDAPVFGLGGIPDPDDFSPPEPIEITEPTAQALIQVSIPDITFPTIAAFDGDVPDFALPAAPLPLIPPILAYSGAEWLELLERTRELLEGEGLDLAIEERMANLSDAGIDRDALAQTTKAETEWAGRGFGLPPGMLVRDVANIQQEAGRKRRTGYAKVRDEAAKVAQENLKAALVAGVALEKLCISLHTEQAGLLLEAEKIKVKSALALFNASVALFNARQKGREAKANAYRSEVEAVLSVSASSALLAEGAEAKAAMNEAKVDLFSAQVGLAKARTAQYVAQVKGSTAPYEGYRAQLSALKAQAEVEEANVQAYRDAVRAYSYAVDAATSSAGVNGTYYQVAATAAGVIEANARSYATHNLEAAKIAGSWKSIAATQNEVLSANLRAFTAAGETQTSYFRTLAAKAGAAADIAAAEASIYGATLRKDSGLNKATTQIYVAGKQHALAVAENVTQAQTLAAMAAAEADKINVGALSARAHAYAALAQGGMSAAHVSAGVDGSGSISAGGSWSSSDTESTGGSLEKTEITVTGEK